MKENKQLMGLFGAVSTTVGLIIGSAIFVLLPELFGMTGGSVWLVYILSGIPTFFAAFYLIQMGGALPVSGAHYVGITRWVNPMFGFVTTFGGLICILSVTPLVAMGFGEYIQAYLPGVNAKIMAMTLIGLFCLINFFGVKLFNAIQISMFVLLLGAMVIYIAGGLPAGEAANRLPFMAGGTENFIIAIAIASNSWLGIVGVTEIAGVVKNPKRNIPIALVISVVLITLLYAGMAYGFSGLMSFEESVKIGSSAILKGAESFLPRPLVAFTALGAMLAMATSINAFIMLTINIFSPICRNRIIPQGFIKPNRFGAPGRMILFFFIVSAVLIQVFGAQLSSYAIMSMVGLMFMQFGGAVAVVRMPKMSPDLFAISDFRFPVAVRWIIFLLCTIVFWGMIGFGFMADWKVSLAFFGFALASAVYYIIRSAFMKKKGVSLSETVAKSNGEIVKTVIE